VVRQDIETPSLSFVDVCLLLARHPSFSIKLLRPLRQNCCTVTRTRGGDIVMPPHPPTRPPPPTPPPPWRRRGSSFSSSPLRAITVVLRLGGLLYGPTAQYVCQVVDQRCQMLGAVVPIGGCARWHRLGSGGPPGRGVARGGGCQQAELGVAAGVRIFAARPPPLSCQADYARLITGRTPRVMDQDLHRLDVWLGNCQCLAGMMARLLLPAHWHRLVFVFVAGGSILLGHGVAPGARGTPTASRGG
jgi:hypothetical protein